MGRENNNNTCIRTNKEIKRNKKEKYKTRHAHTQSLNRAVRTVIAEATSEVWRK